MTGVRICIVAVLTLIFGAFAAFADDPNGYPNKPIKIIVASPAGGASDVIARIVGAKMSEQWGQPVVIDNRPGANGIIGTDLVAKAAPDGYTLILSLDSAMTLHQHMHKNLPYDPFKDFTHISTIANSVVVVLTNGNLPIHNFSEFLKFAKEQPEKISVGIGTMATQMIMERVSLLTGAKVLKVPFKGGSEVVSGLIGGHIDMAVAGYTPFREFVRDGKVQALASTGLARSVATPKVPTLLELGYPGFDTGVWMGLSAPAKTPDVIIKKISTEISKILRSKDVIERFDVLGLEPMPSDPEKTLALIRKQSQDWAKVIKEAGVKVE